MLLFARLLLGDARAQENLGVSHYPNRERSWNRIPYVAVASRENDPRIALAVEAVEFWNKTFAEIGAPRSRRAYRELLGSREHLTLIPHRAGSACLTQVIQVQPNHRGVDVASRLVDTLGHAGYEVQGSYVPIHLLSSFNHCVWDRLPNADRLWADLVELPCEPSVSLTDVARIAELVKSVIRQ